MAERVDPLRADRDRNTAQHVTADPCAVLQQGLGLDRLVAGAVALLAKVDQLQRGLVADEVQHLGLGMLRGLRCGRRDRHSTKRPYQQQGRSGEGDGFAGSAHGCSGDGQLRESKATTSSEELAAPRYAVAAPSGRVRLSYFLIALSAL
jgi:hypothetical protein